MLSFLLIIGIIGLFIKILTFIPDDAFCEDTYIDTDDNIY